MKKLFHLANDYLSTCDWKDLALVKVCLFAMGLFVGTHVLEEDKKWVKLLAFLAFVATYVALMKKFFQFLKDAWVEVDIEEMEAAEEEEAAESVPVKEHHNWFEVFKKDRYIRLK